MNKEQMQHCYENTLDFTEKYAEKYTKGQKAHGGSMWTMGAYQALENAEEECLDNWSYLRQIRKCLDEIKNRTDELDHISPLNVGGLYNIIVDVRAILNRIKDDNNLDEPIKYELTEENR